MAILLRLLILMFLHRAIIRSYKFPVRFAASIGKDVVPDNRQIARMTRAQSVPNVVSKKETVQPKPKNKQYSDFIQCLKTKDSDRALALLKEVTMVKDNVFIALMNNIATVLYKKEHLSAVQDIIQRLEAIDVKPDEPLYNSLVKCHMDDNNVEEALKVFNHMVESKIEVKSRTLLPIMEGLRDSNDVDNMLSVIDYIAKTIDIKAEHLTIVLEILAKNSCNTLSEEQKKAFDAFIAQSSMQLLGLPYSDTQTVAARFNNLTMEAQKEEGVLAQFVPDTAIDTSNLTTHGYVTAAVQHSNCTANRLQEALPMMVNTDPCHPIGLSEDPSSTTEFVEKLYVRSVVDTVRKSTAVSRAKVVYVDAKSCLCPNCNAKLASLPLNESEKQIVRSKLRSISQETNDKLNVSRHFCHHCIV